MTKATLICDLQFGSTGKGLIAGYLAERNCPDVVMTAWMPNAGHTFVERNGTKHIHTMLANGIVSPNLKFVLIGPGSVVNPEALLLEIKTAQERGYLVGVRVLVHPHAAVVTQEHREFEERSMVKIGSTRKGCGAAITQKIQRDPDHSCVAKDVMPLGPWKVITTQEYNQVVDEAERILIEGAQGFSLSINQGLYPYCTSRDVTPMQILADCGVSYHLVDKVVGAMRVHPIRVSNRYDEQGEMIGWSGPGYPDQEEITWEKLGVEPETTTVTKLQRRVFTFSEEQLRQAVRLCRPDEIFLNFVNYLGGNTEVMKYVNQINAIAGFNQVKYLGFGPRVDQVRDIHHGLPITQMNEGIK